MYIVIAIIIFGFLIATHELGHFLAAKLCNVRVLEFSIGMGPAFFKRQRGETLYALRAFPIGGYCAMEEDVESDDPRSFGQQSVWKRFLILLSGAAMNFLTGLIILLIIVPSSAAFTTPTITDFYEGCPYESAQGLQKGDTFYKIDGQRVYFTSNILMLLNRDKGETHDLVMIRDGEKIVLDDFGFTPLEYKIDGETQVKYGMYYGVKESGFAAGLKYSFDCSKDFVRMVWMGLSDLVTGAVGLKDLSGPVGIVELISDVGNSAETTAAASFSIAYLAAFIAINLAVMNLLPIPALDGGRILFLFITGLFHFFTKRKLNPKYEGYVHAGGLFLLLGLMAFVMINDIYKLFV
ncbi:MAG: site-2 protease family protein [Oscillospiraceae bacterium]